MSFTIKFLTAIFVLAAGMSLHAQERVISEKEFKDAEVLSSKTLQNRKYRSTGTSESFRDSEVIKYVTITEFAPPDRERTIRKHSQGSSTKRTESIKIGDKVFYRDGEGGWTMTSPDSGNRFTVLGKRDGPGTPAQPTFERVQKLTLDVGFGKEIADLYQQNETFTFGAYKSFTVRKMWISKDGLPLKFEINTTQENGDPINKYLLIYEYDQNIKIEAPIIPVIEPKVGVRPAS